MSWYDLGLHIAGLLIYFIGLVLLANQNLPLAMVVGGSVTCLWIKLKDMERRLKGGA